MRCDRRVLLLGLLGLGACAVTPTETAILPEFRGFVSVDPVRHAIEQGADLLTHRNRLTGQPWETARLVQALEFLAVEVPNGPRWNVMLPMAQLTLPAARAEWRQAFGIAPEARAQEVIDSLTELRSAYAEQRPTAAPAALRAPIFTPGGQETLNRFADPPTLPRTTRAMIDARQELMVQSFERRSGRGFVIRSSGLREPMLTQHALGCAGGLFGQGIGQHESRRWIGPLPALNTIWEIKAPAMPDQDAIATCLAGFVGRIPGCNAIGAFFSRG